MHVYVFSPIVKGHETAAKYSYGQIDSIEHVIA